MSLRLFCWTLVIALFAVSTSACRSSDATRTQTPSATETAASAPDSSSDLEALYWARQDSARARFTTADVRFMTMMITHHAQALVMAALAPTHGASEQVQTLAARITNAQRDEINTMQRWLRLRDRPVPTIDIEGTALRVNGTSVHGRDMAGILTQAQIDELDAARGTVFDRLFLTYMIEHHRGAVAMVDTLLGTDGAAQDEATFRLASDINADQTTEIARMQRMLNALPETPTGP
jgi:uncharacterized protein (DUF305 family)